MPTPAVPPTIPDDASDIKVAYLVSKYPALSHTFIEREIAGLRALGARIDTFSVRRCPNAELISAAMRQEAAETTVLIDEVPATFPRAHARLLTSQPSAYVRTLMRAVTTGEPHPKTRLWQGFYFAEAVKLHDQMRARGLRHVHVHFANVSADVARLAVAIGRFIDGPTSDWRWSLTMHGPTEFEGVDKVDLPAKILDADAVSCITDFTRSQLMRYVDPAHWHKLAITHMTIDPTIYMPPPDGRAGRQGQPLRLLFVGRLVPEKGGPLLLEALTLLKERGTAVQVRFVGDGPARKLLERSTRERGLEQMVEFVGAVGQDDMIPHYHWADVFTLPSYMEGLPVVIMEALATELPVITSRINGIPELVHDELMGHVLTPGRADLLANAIEDQAHNPDRRQAQGHAGRKAVLDSYTIDSQAPVMADFLRAVSPTAGK
ncbi:glycosyltransferase family 4 protein [Dermatophilus congolensis]|uniref:glycosyltransferase family 4 protein n=1 Tax=Dermatophilus congolensis TaxID=1863 RepID=UPI001AAF35A2|nr:glycosyltransferase family 4 protein [Dermatophilus congolensis]MBO3142145.1 glycosyltransferase family 4 protein [Dermatophilus congolensis]MBO3151137.1 glycosyltransferase family 4 protein [Dermatophilus congolensis]MBO3161861.1 glycosyltransferase family 4 protein [Dermatophilus congolensis]MBO3162420.1 glycosyltransferase family 4 protein [Dermatophilus congolensis]MBO3175978.1 glycosyltransferase family 4 protein [Dermatophilus congolensis]